MCVFWDSTNSRFVAWRNNVAVTRVVSARIYFSPDGLVWSQAASVQTTSASDSIIYGLSLANGNNVLLLGSAIATFTLGYSLNVLAGDPTYVGSYAALPHDTNYTYAVRIR